MCFNVIKVSLLLKSWSHLLSFVSKAEAISPEFGDLTSKTAQSQHTRLRCARGLGELAQGRFAPAARAFLQASIDYCPDDFISPSNLALYGGLTALAAFDRSELQEKLISNSGFKLFLELEPQLRDAVHAFHTSRYATSFRLLDEVKPCALLDMYLAPHVPLLYTQIRKRAMCQYFTAYSSIKMQKMASAFNTTLAGLQEELVALILEDRIKARIDSHTKVLYAQKINEQTATFQSALKLGKEYELKTAALLIRCAVAKAGLSVKASGRNEDLFRDKSPPNAF